MKQQQTTQLEWFCFNLTCNIVKNAMTHKKKSRSMTKSHHWKSIRKIMRQCQGIFFAYVICIHFSLSLVLHLPSYHPQFYFHQSRPFIQKQPCGGSSRGRSSSKGESKANKRESFVFFKFYEPKSFSFAFSWCLENNTRRNWRAWHRSVKWLMLRLT